MKAVRPVTGAISIMPTEELVRNLRYECMCCEDCKQGKQLSTHLKCYFLY